MLQKLMLSSNRIWFVCFYYQSNNDIYTYIHVVAQNWKRMRKLSERDNFRNMALSFQSPVIIIIIMKMSKTLNTILFQTCVFIAVLTEA